MIRTMKQAMLIALCFATFGSVGCTTIDSMNGTQEALAEEKIQVGDDVFLHYVGGESLEIEITNIGAETVSGIADNGRKVVINYADLSSIGHKRVEVLKTAGAALGIIALSPLIVVGVLATGGGY